MEEEGKCAIGFRIFSGSILEQSTAIGQRRQIFAKRLYDRTPRRHHF
eukprot:CAMPEP_0174289712 /NCGR_PEP_ID=MMETSP0809-20121228/26028_1 /TAXON_ID=73025 ORGANISM="Eutreptiella gymnastica-like, Strain CCMP1594" /NCGR_SAMPLE_ID=MMETSP0809 /ASSEMBLY_ACC=CAM_ASM_000658 /LENGTH=46 /DNA_ID= /DNA_START= /DNA_END= /DNA_ORIENTATION=